MDINKPRRAINIRQVGAKLGNASRSTIKRVQNDPDLGFPQPFKLTDSVNASLLWWDDEIDEYLSSRPRVLGPFCAPVVLCHPPTAARGKKSATCIPVNRSDLSEERSISAAETNAGKRRGLVDG